jgi:hypothetical protein
MSDMEALMKNAPYTATDEGEKLKQKEMFFLYSGQ